MSDPPHPCARRSACVSPRAPSSFRSAWRPWRAAKPTIIARRVRRALLGPGVCRTGSSWFLG